MICKKPASPALLTVSDDSLLRSSATPPASAASAATNVPNSPVPCGKSDIDLLPCCLVVALPSGRTWFTGTPVTNVTLPSSITISYLGEWVRVCVQNQTSDDTGKYVVHDDGLIHAVPVTGSSELLPDVLKYGTYNRMT